MDLNNFGIIKKVLITGKASQLRDGLNKITFQVHVDANKITIKKAVEAIWKVKVDSVNVMNCKGKNKLFARKPFRSSDMKKAIVTLKKGQRIDLPGGYEKMGVSRADVDNSGK